MNSSAVTIDQSRCVGASLCREIAPGVFVDGEEGRSRVAEGGEIDPADAEEAAETCPVQAITVTLAPPDA